jgi:hypothetical protein
MLVHQGRWKKLAIDFVGDPVWISFSGMVGAALGLAIVLVHNIWISEWPVLITLIGWIFLLQAIVRLFSPDTFVKVMKDLMAKSGHTIFVWVWLLVGAYLTWKGFSLN